MSAESTANSSRDGLRLKITLGDNPVSMIGQHNLLVGFQFGPDPVAADNPAMVHIALEPLQHESLFERWWYHGEVKYSTLGAARIAECEDYVVVCVQQAETGSGDFRTFACEAYRELLQAVRSTKHKRIMKIWNYFAEINSGDDDLEKYRQFSVGRARAFAELGIQDEESPTGTAIGALPGSPLTLVALASKRKFRSAENPRQVSAFDYPKTYGPSSPKFSRSGFVSTGNHKLFLISGTAAIVGHESTFPYDVELQADETFRNLDLLCAAVSELVPDGTRLVLDEESVLRVYLRNPEDYDSVSQKLNTVRGHSNRKVAFLQGNICRRELMIEIDGAKVV